MAYFKVRMNYKASITFDVEAEDEGKALDMARELAEDADAEQFTIWDEGESEIIGRG